MPNPTATSEPGTTGANSLRTTTIASEMIPIDEGRDAGRTEAADEPEELLEEVAFHLVDAEQLGQLTHDDRQREADDETLQHRLRDEAREESESEHAGQDGEDPDHEGQRDRERHELIGACRREIGDDRGRQRGGRGHRPGDEVSRAAECRVQEQGARRRIEADHRRHAGDRRVGQGLRDEDRPHGQARDDVPAQPRRLVTGEGREEPGHRRVSSNMAGSRSPG